MMTKKQYLKMKREARYDAKNGGTGYRRKGDYVVFYGTFGGYEAYKVNESTDFYKYAHSCRRLAQLLPGTSAAQLADCKKFLEEYKK